MTPTSWLWINSVCFVWQLSLPFQYLQQTWKQDHWWFHYSLFLWPPKGIFLWHRWLISHSHGTFSWGIGSSPKWLWLEWLRKRQPKDGKSSEGCGCTSYILVQWLKQQTERCESRRCWTLEQGWMISQATPDFLATGMSCMTSVRPMPQDHLDPFGKVAWCYKLS